MKTSVASILEDLGPSLSSEVVENLVTNGLSPDAARQRVSRAGNPVKRLRGIRFKNREYFLFLDGQFTTHLFRERLSQAFDRTNSAYGRALTGLRNRGGEILTAHFPIASGLPIQLAKGQLLHSAVESTLTEVGLIRRIETPSGDFTCLYDQFRSNDRCQAVATVENIVLSALQTWLVKTGWSSSNVLQIRSNGLLPKIGQFAWDFAGPCYLAGLTNMKTSRANSPDRLINAFIAGDIVLGREITMNGLKPFLSKWDCLRAQRRQQRFQPMIVVDSMHPEALEQLRARGVLICMPSVVFGQGFAHDISKLVYVIENAAAAVVNNPQSVFELIDRIAKVEGAALNLRGIVLEMMVAHLYRLNGYQIDIRQQVCDENGNHAEIDVKANHPTEVVCCECKGVGPNAVVGVPDVEDWLDRVVPRIKSWMKGKDSIPSKRRFEFYSSTDYSEPARELIKETIARHKKIPISFLTGNDIVKTLQENNQNALVRVFREQFSPK